MVTIAEDYEALYPADINKPIPLKGFVNGNWGNFNRDWCKTTSANIKPGMGVILATGDNGEDSMTEWAANSSNGYGVAGWHKAQLATQQTAYAQYDLGIIYAFFMNKGMIFQGYVDDSTANLNVGIKMKANTTGEFLLRDHAQYRVYAQTIYYIADTGASYAKCLVFREADMIGGGTTQT